MRESDVRRQLAGPRELFAAVLVLAHRQLPRLAVLVLLVQNDVHGRDADEVAAVADEARTELVGNVFHHMLLERVLEEGRVRALVAVEVSDLLVDLRRKLLELRAPEKKLSYPLVVALQGDSVGQQQSALVALDQILLVRLLKRLLGETFDGLLSGSFSLLHNAEQHLTVAIGVVGLKFFESFAAVI